MKEINIVWNKVTAHSRFWAIVIFVGVLPAVFFYAGVRVERLNNEQARLQKLTTQTLLQSERGLCRISDCTLEVSAVAPAASASAVAPAAVPTIKVVSPKKGDHIDPKLPVKVIWNVSPNFSLAQVTILLLDSDGRAVSKLVTATANRGSAYIESPAKLLRTPYTVLIQGAAKLDAGKNIPFAYSGEFYL